ncbi:hypothetical protein ACWC9T_40550, partial [Kitasatospora sp. NPDC001159]
MSDVIVSAEAVEEVWPVELAPDVLDEQLIGQLVDRARAGGIKLTGQGGLLQQLTKRVLEAALEGEITDHLGLLTSARQGDVGVSRVRPVPAMKPSRVSGRYC